MNPITSTQGFFGARDGTSLYFEVKGKGRPLLLVPGLLCRREHWRHQVDHFSKKYQVVLFDNRGHYASARPKNDRNLTLQHCANDVLDLISHLGVDSPVLFGHSMGVPIATLAASQAQERVRAIVLICGSMNNPFQSMFYTDRLNPVFKASVTLSDWAPEVFSFLWKKFTIKNRFSYFLASRFGFNPRVAEKQDILSYMSGVAETPPDVFHQLLSDYVQWDGRTILRETRVPSLVIAGDHDWITPLEVQEEIAELLPHSQIEVVRDGSHNAHQDFPRVVNARIERFLREVNY